MGAGPQFDDPALTPERRRKASEILTAALDLDAESTVTFVASAAAGDAEVEAAVLRALGERQAAITPTFSANQVLSGRYRIVRFVGRGGMGEVYEAEDLELAERVALKTLRPEIASDQRMIARFKQEIQLARKITHPNVCRIYDLSYHVESTAPESAVLFLTMEFLDGETLANQRKRTGRMSTTEALPMVRQMAEGLDAAHRAGVIHRDFKPSNVMLAPAGDVTRAVITDFGLARSAKSLSGEATHSAGGVVGTLDYLAPEVLTGGIASVASDIYALGLVMYLMVTGAKPFPEETPMAGAIRRAKDPVPSPCSVAPDIDEKWERAILRCLRPNPEERFPSALGVVQALESGEGTPVPLPRRRALFASVVAVAAMLALWLALGGPAFFRRGPSSEARGFYNRGTDQLEAGAYFAATKALGEATRLAPDYTMAHARLAASWLELELPEKASQEMLLARRNQGSSLSSQERLYVDAVDLTLTREFDAAAQKYEAIARRTPNDAVAHLDLGAAYEKAQQPQKARAEYTRATELRPTDAAPWLRLAMLRAQAAERTDSDAAFAKAEELYQANSNLEGITEVAFRRGMAANRRQSMDEADTFLQRALSTAAVTKNVHQELRTKLTLANNAFQRGDSRLAERYAKEAVDTARLNQMDSLVTRGLLNLGNALLRRRDYSGAERYYREGLELASRSGSHQLEAFAQLALSSLYDQEGRPDQTEGEAKQALAFLQHNNFVRESNQCLVLMGRAQRIQGDISAALESFGQAAAISEKAKDPFLTALAQESIGSLRFQQEDYPEALAHYELSLKFSTDKEHIGYASLHLGDTLWRLGRYQEADERFAQAQEAAAKLEKLGSAVAGSRAKMLLSRGRYQESEIACRRALKGIGDTSPPDTADLKRILGLAQIGMGNRAAGRRTCEEAFHDASTLSDVWLRVNTALALLEARSTSGDWQGLIETFSGVQKLFSGFPESNWKALTLVARADQALGRPEEAQRAAGAALSQAEAIQGRWGPAIFQVYLSRPDIQRLWRTIQAIIPNHG